MELLKLEDISLEHRRVGLTVLDKYGSMLYRVGTLGDRAAEIFQECTDKEQKHRKLAEKEVMEMADGLRSTAESKQRTFNADCMNSQATFNQMVMQEIKEATLSIHNVVTKEHREQLRAVREENPNMPSYLEEADAVIHALKKENATLSRVMAQQRAFHAFKTSVLMSINSNAVKDLQEEKQETNAQRFGIKHKVAPLPKELGNLQTKLDIVELETAQLREEVNEVVREKEGLLVQKMALMRSLEKVDSVSLFFLLSLNRCPIHTGGGAS